MYTKVLVRERASLKTDSDFIVLTGWSCNQIIYHKVYICIRNIIFFSCGKAEPILEINKNK